MNEMKKIFFIVMLIMVFSALAVYGDSTSSMAALQIAMLNQDPSPANAGDTAQLRFKVENTGGGDVTNVDIELLQDYPYTIVDGSATQHIDAIQAYQTGNNYIFMEYTVKIDKDAKEGQQNLRLRYRYNGNDWTTVTFSVSISTQQFAQIIYVDKAQLDPGRETDVKFTINNVGNAALENMVFSWQEPTGAILPVYSGATKYIKYLDVGKSVDLVYKVIADVNADPGLYQIDMTLTAVTNSSRSVVSTRAGVMVGGKTDFDVAFSESSQGQTSLSVANTGNNPAQSVSVIIPQQESFRVTGTNSAIIGNLDKGD
jgi:hypothetical protein